MTKKKRHLHTKDNRGISLLLAVLISFSALLVGFAVARIALKEVALSGSVRDSEIAFYAANSGVECGLFEDLRSLAFDPDTLPLGPVICNNQTVPVSSTIINPGQDQFCIGTHSERGQTHVHLGCWRLTTPNISLEVGNTSASCFSLRIIKEKFQTTDQLDNVFTYFTTALESRGYNTCSTVSPRRLERAMRALY